MHDSITPSGLPPTPLDPRLLCSPHPTPPRPQPTLMSPAFCFVYRSTVNRLFTEARMLGWWLHD